MFKEKILQHKIKKAENEFFKTNGSSHYYFFGYIMDEERETPMFFETPVDNNHTLFGKFIIPFSPNILKHCIIHLTNEAKCSEVNNIDLFISKCNKIKENDEANQKGWDEAIEWGSQYLTWAVNHIRLNGNEDNNQKQ